MNDIFVYGTLLNDEVLSILFDSPLPKHRAHLPGYKRVKVLGATFPAIRPEVNSGVDGALLTGLNNADLMRLDQYEGRYYERVSVLAHLDGDIPQHCQTYVFRQQFYEFLSGEDWCNDSFRERHMQQFLSGLLIES